MSAPHHRGTLPRGRLAPSPTGALHLGNARSFLIAWLSVRSRGGSLLLRMEDLDHPKVKPGSAQQALDDLHWLGLDWDEGPDMGGPFAPYTQSERIPAYRGALDELRVRRLVYPCVCSRSDVEAAQGAPHPGEDGTRYPGTCRERFEHFDEAEATLPGNRLPGWRFRTPDRKLFFHDVFHGSQTQNVHERIGDFVIARHADGAGYMLAVVVDDAAMGVTEVIRGDDLLATTHRQLLLHSALRLTPPAFTHVPLVVGENGHRLAKRHGDTRIAALRANGVPPEQVVGLLAHWCGWADWGEHLSPTDLITRYDLAKLPVEPTVLTAKVKRYLRVC